MEKAGGQVVVSYRNPVERFRDSYPISKKRGDADVHSTHQSSSQEWNANSWDWDPARFVAKPLQVTDTSNEAQDRGLHRSDGEDDRNLGLKLGGGDSSDKSGTSDETDSEGVQPTGSKPVKRVKSGANGSSGNYPRCLVDGCTENLSKAKDYHRRHKVCELHSKTAEALVGKQSQRFCQQCSRFHPLAEFDEGKRSCRRRLAGHNRRRRKTHPEASNLQLLVPQNHEKYVNDANIVSLLSVLSRAQRNDQDMSRALPDNMVPKHQESSAKHVALVDQNLVSTRDLLGVLTAASPAPHMVENQSPQTIPGGNEPVNEAARLSFHRRSSTSSNSLTGDVELTGNKTSPSVALQLFSSSSGDCLAKDKSDRNLLSSHTSNQPRRGEISYSKPVEHDFFASQNLRDKLKDGNSANHEDEIMSLHGRESNCCSTSLQLFRGSPSLGEHEQIEKASTSGSYLSSSGLQSDFQDRTGRIIFKLFDKDPSNLPGSLRTQICNWLSNSPSDMESYIRPGCVVLSLYVLMPAIEWDKLEEKLLDYLKSLVNDIDAHFWGTGRFLVHTKKQMAASYDGKVRLHERWRFHGIPDLISVSPLAVVTGKEMSLVLKGRRLLASGTKIHCTHPVRYCITKHTSSSCQDMMYDEITMSSFKVEGLEPNQFSRCFIEVDNGSRGSSFPIIIADKAICDELKLVEPDIDGTLARDQREQALHFLNELGWLFQRKHNSFMPAFVDYGFTRSKFLLIFSVERDFSALVETVLDILVEVNKGTAMEGALNMLSEIHLLSRAVNRRCRAMVRMLINYSAIDPMDNSSQRYIFAPDTAGPGGVTPLHLAASMPHAESVIDALTSDPFEVGLSSWNSVLDTEGLSPSTYASMTNHHSYNDLVARKLTDRRNHQVSTISATSEQQVVINTSSDSKKPRKKPCSRCAVDYAFRYTGKKSGSRTLLHRSYIHSMLAIAAVCVCVCVLLRGHPIVSFGSPFAWEHMRYGAI